MYTQDLEAGLVMFMVDNCLYLLNLGHKLAHLSHMNMEKFDPLTCSFSLQYHPESHIKVMRRKEMINNKRNF